ncbi:MAG: PAS domain S-box protein [Planctomycetes bacterium]|nr:PAS domain S-box protein [Planctomycetota bacterium]
MADPGIKQLRRKLGWLSAFSLGAALAFAVLLGVMAIVPGAGNNFVVWGTVLGFCLLVVLVFAAVSWRMASIERAVISSRSDLKNTGQLLAEQVAKREQVEGKLREELLFPQLNPGPVLRFDAHGMITRCNHAAISLISGESPTGKDICKVVPGLTTEQVDDCLRGAALEPVEVQWGRRWYICHMRGVPEASAGLLYASDITQTKELEFELRHQEKRARAILDGAADAIFIVVVGGIVQAINPATRKLFGWESEEIVGRNVDLLLPDLFEHRGGDRLWILAEYARRRSTGPIERSHYAKRKDGTRFPISLSVSVYDYEGTPRVSCIVRDISDRLSAAEMEKQQAQQLHAQNEELENLVNELNEFNYVASHDLQEPLRTMSTYCGLLKVDLGAELPKRAQEDISAILEASLRMQRLITDLLEYSRSGHRELKMVEVDLQEIMKRVTGDLQARIVETGGKVEYSDLPSVVGDDMQLGRVMQNLVANGLKFRRPGVKPLVKVKGERVGDEVSVEVTDNGIGIEGQYLDQIFMPFKRLHGIGKYEGSGIGLSVCRKIVERHGGKIQVESTPGEGSRFRLTLPAVKQATAATQSGAE